jgi:hypothetical protein
MEFEMRHYFSGLLTVIILLLPLPAAWYFQTTAETTAETTEWYAPDHIRAIRERLKKQALIEKLEQACRAKGGMIIPAGLYDLGVMYIGDERKANVPISTGNSCLFKPGASQAALELFDFYTQK